MKRIIIASFFVATALVSILGCFPEKSEKTNLYSGPTLLEFKNFTLGQLTAALNSKGVHAATAQTDSTRAVLLNTRTTDTVLVQLVGPQSASPIIVNYTVRATLPTGMAGTVATEGIHYAFATAGARSVTIPANSSFGYILIKPIANSLTTVGDTRVIPIDLIGNTSIKANPNFDSFFVTLRR